MDGLGDGAGIAGCGCRISQRSNQLVLLPKGIHQSLERHSAQPGQDYEVIMPFVDAVKIGRGPKP